MYGDITTYGNVLGGLHIWDGDGWKAESMAWKESAYVASNLSGMPEMTFSGPDAQALLSRLSINDVFDWPIGSSKHLVMPDEHGYVATHGLAVRDAEDSFRSFANIPWAVYHAYQSGMNVQVGLRPIFIFQVAGPRSIQVLERLTGKPLRDLGFLDIAPVRIPGIDVDVELELSRIGMAYTLAYEVRGPLEHGPAVFDAIYRAGQDFEIKRLGWRTYVVNHTEGGFPQLGCTFLPSAFADAGFLASPAGQAFASATGASLVGSADLADFRARLRTPHENNWGWRAKFDHDFVGRAAIAAEDANPRRKTVTLRWNTEDVLDVFASQFRREPEYRAFEWPTTPQAPAGGHADIVTKGSVEIGYSSLAVYSYYFRETISHGVIDVGDAVIGDEVVVHWGDHQARIKPIRATVERFPYLDLPSNKAFDLNALPSGVAS